ncbi:MAG: FmdB family zinc ribbon protein [Candidatus Solibacter sp.]
MSVTIKAGTEGSSSKNTPAGTLMPLYDYRCHQCGEIFEVKQKFADEVLKIHETCGGELERLISLPAIQFKGTGWYVTDYKGNGKSPAPSVPGKTSESSNTGKTEGKSESKNEAKTESKSEPKSESKPSPAPSTAP